jgi:hypothetical protein
MRGGFVMSTLGAVAMDRMQAKVGEKMMHYAQRFIQSRIS